MKPLDDDGRELDANFAVQLAPAGAYLILESRGGSDHGPRNSRNANYSEALEVLLQRLGRHRATLSDVEVYSSVTMSWSPERRRITAPDYSLPLQLSELQDVRDFRLQLARASAVLGRKGTSGGNPTKRLRLTLVWPSVEGRSAVEIEEMLAARRAPTPPREGEPLQYAPLGHYLRSTAETELHLTLSQISKILGRPLPSSAQTRQFWANSRDHHQTRRSQWLSAGFEAFLDPSTESVRFKRIANEEPTDDPNELRRRTRLAQQKMEQAADGQPPEPQGSSHVEERTSTIKRFVRDPNVVAWVLIAAKGICEVCDSDAPFLGEDGKPFLEVHHIRPLGEGGPDLVSNAVAVCPNCHRKLHYSADRESVRRATIKKVLRLMDYPVRADRGVETRANSEWAFAEHPNADPLQSPLV